MAQNTELDELKQAMKKLEEENASLKDTIQALSSAVLKDGQQRQPEREVKATLMETKYTNPKFVTDEEKKAIKFEMWTDDMHNTKFNDLIPSRMRHFRRKYSETSVKPFFFQDIDGRFRTPTAGDYRFDVGGCSGSRDDNEKHKVDWYLCHVPKQFDVAKNIVDNDSGGYEGEHFK